MGEYMKNDEYKKLVSKYELKENKIKNALISFFVGGIIGFLAELFVFFLMERFNLDRKISSTILCIFIIAFASLLTALGKFDDFVSKVKMGIILPTTGFAHSMTSSALDYKKDGLISLGSNFFKLSGSVILYGVVGAFFLSLLKVIIWQL